MGHKEKHEQMQEMLNKEIKKVSKQKVDLEEEIENFQKTLIPRCFLCKKDFIHEKDLTTGEVDIYVWVANCECEINKNIRIRVL